MHIASEACQLEAKKLELILNRNKSHAMQHNVRLVSWQRPDETNPSSGPPPRQRGSTSASLQSTGTAEKKGGALNGSYEGETLEPLAEMPAVASRQRLTLHKIIAYLGGAPSHN